MKLRLIPNTLFARIMVLMTVMIILSFVAGYTIYLLFVARPSASSTADIFALHINSVYSAVETLEPEKRNQYLDNLVDSGFLHVRRDVENKPGREAEYFYEDIFLEYYPQLLFDHSAEIRFDYDDLLHSENPRIIWAKVTIDGKPIWLGSPMGEFKADTMTNMLALLGLILFLTAIGAFLIMRIVKKPLGELVSSAKVLGSGKAHEPLDETGPKEFATVSHAFNKMAEDIQKLADDRNLMLAGISHDLRTPLARVRLSLDMIDDKIEQNLYHGMVQDIEDIDKIVGQFLTYVRDGLDEPFAYEDINDIVEHVAAGFKMEGKNIQLNLGNINKSMMKPLAMQRLAMNLINNAWSYGQQDVEVETAMNRHYLYLSVKDRGEGITEEEIERLKQPFTRGDESRTDTKGAGLGLAIVDRIIQWHHGKFDVQSREGGGMIIRVGIPITLQV